ncbi:MAG TPA: ABC transporter substrate-binding protein [Xanthobacteraceae bacterium]|nr:ABC transporter substrate-binding protein [Xanthobacteraceae bacterium]
MNRMKLSLGVAVSLATAALIWGGSAQAQQKKLTVGVVLPLSGTYADQGRHYEDGMKLYQKLHGNSAAGVPVEMVVRDDQGPGSGDLARRLTQELIVRNGADVILGYSFTPTAMSVATLLNEAKKPAILVNATGAAVLPRSEYFVRVSITAAQFAEPLARWALKNNIKTVYTLVADFAPGIEMENAFKKVFEGGGGKIIGGARTPVSAMEYSPFLQRAIEAKPEAIFAFNPGGDVSVAFMKQAKERNLAKAGIKLIVSGDVVDESMLAAMGDAVDGVVSSLNYQPDLKNPANEKFLKGFHDMMGANAVPSARTVQGYDGMALIYQALEKTGGKTDADSLLAALKEAKIDSPRGPISIDPKTRDIVQNMYIRRGVQKDGKWVNATEEAFENIKGTAN